MKKILVIDDNPLSRYIIKKAINQYSIKEIDDASNIEEIIKEEKPDLVLLDIVMPHKNGFDILKLIRHIPTIVVSSLDHPEASEKAYALGAKHYLSKPFSISFLSNLINEELAYIS